MIEEVMEDLLLFVEPGIGEELDLDRGFIFLDKRYWVPAQATKCHPE
jgi:hypothetical protein